jgi:hypothetical protein
MAVPVAPKDDSKETHRRLKQMLDPTRDRARQTFFKVSKIILGALAVAAVIQMILPPDLPPKTTDLVLPPQINMDLEAAAMEHRPGELRYTEDQVNAYLAYSLRSKKAALSTWLTFERALVGFDEGVGRMTIERSLFGYSLYTSTAYAVAIAGDKVVMTNKGGSIGRLPIHPLVMEHGDVLFASVWNALNRDRKALGKMAAVDFHPQLAVITPRPQ